MFGEPIAMERILMLSVPETRPVERGPQVSHALGTRCGRR